jgi:hypothetical protein
VPIEPIEAERHQRWVSNVTAVAIIGFSISWATLLFLIARGWYGNPVTAADPGVLQDYAQNMARGWMPYRDFRLEYPPLSLVPILLPVALGGMPFVDASYRPMFQLVEAGFGFLTMLLVMWSVTALARGRRDVLIAAAMVALSPLLLGPLMLTRYDLLPALFAAAGTYLLVSGRARLAGAAIGLGILAKVYPVVMVPFALAWLWRRGERREAGWLLGVMTFVVGAGLLPFLLLAPAEILGDLVRAFQRPLQVESLGGALLLARQVVTGIPVQIVHTFDSYNVQGIAAEALGVAQTAALAASLLATFWLFARGRPTTDRFVLAVAAALCAWVAFGRVFSPQYLIWLIAPLAVITTRRWPVAQVGLAVAIALTGWYYPRYYSDFLDRAAPMWVTVVLVRDLVLVALAGYLLVRLWPRESAEPADDPARDRAADSAADSAADQSAEVVSTSLSTDGSGSRGVLITRP